MRAIAGEDLRQLGWAFAMSGGGAKGAYTAGVMSAFHEMGVFDDGLSAVRALHGVSTGALVASLVATENFHVLEESYTAVRTEDVLIPNHHLAYKIGGIGAVAGFCAILGPPRIFETAPLRDLIVRYMGGDLAGFAQMIDVRDRLDVGFISVDLVTGDVKTIGNQTPGIKPEDMMRALLASTNQPGFMDLVPLGPQQHLHGDGGLREFLPVRPVLHSPFRDEIDVVVAVMLDPPTIPELEHDLKSFVDVLIRTIEMLSFSVGQKDLLVAQLVDALLRTCQAAQFHMPAHHWRMLLNSFPSTVRDLIGVADGQVSRRLHFLEIVPQEPIGIRNCLNFDPIEMKRVFDQGRREGERALRDWWQTTGHSLIHPHTTFSEPSAA